MNIYLCHHLNINMHAMNVILHIAWLEINVYLVHVYSCSTRSSNGLLVCKLWNCNSTNTT